MLKKKLLAKPKPKSQKGKVMSDELRELAYLKWEQAGRPQGDGVQFWLQAEAELSDCPKAKSKKSCPAPARVAAKTSSTPPTTRKK